MRVQLSYLVHGLCKESFCINSEAWGWKSNSTFRGISGKQFLINPDSLASGCCATHEIPCCELLLCKYAVMRNRENMFGGKGHLNLQLAPVIAICLNNWDQIPH